MTTSIESLDSTNSRVLVGGVEAFRFNSTGIDKVQDASITLAKLATAVKPLGAGQTWQNLTGSRALTTSYTNSTGRPITVVVSGNCSGTGYGSMSTTVDGIVVAGQVHAVPAAGYGCQTTFIVPAGSTYSVAYGGNASPALQTWIELR